MYKRYTNSIIIIIVIIIIIINVLKNNLSGFVRLAWEIVLDAWDRSL